MSREPKENPERPGNPRPANKPPKGTGTSNYVPIVWTTWVFSPEDKKRIKEAELDVEKFFDTLAALVERGHKLSVNPSTSDGFIGVSIWGHTATCLNKGYGVSGEGGTLYSACKSLFWKLEFLQYDLVVTAISDDDDFR